MTILLIAGVFLLALVVYFIKPKNNIIPLQPTAIQDKKPGINNISDKPFDFGKVNPIHYATKVIFFDKDFNLHYSNLDGSNDKTISTKNGNFGVVQIPTISPDGKYLAYALLPDKIADQLNKNPPYEMFGSDDYDLWIVDLNTLEKTKVRENYYYGLASQGIVWNRNSSGFYFQQTSSSTSEAIDKKYFYDIPSKKISEINIFPATTYNLSPDNRFFIKDTKNILQDTIDSNVKLELYSIEGNLVKTLFNSQRYEEFNVNYISSDYAVLTSKSYGKAGDETAMACYVDLINTKTATVTNIKTMPCFIPENPTGIMYPKLGPDNRIYTLYLDRPRTPDSKFTSQIFVYDPNKHEFSSISKQDLGYSDYYFISPNEMLIRTFDRLPNKNAYKAYKLNIENKTLTEIENLRDKELIGGF